MTKNIIAVGIMSFSHRGFQIAELSILTDVIHELEFRKFTLFSSASDFYEDSQQVVNGAIKEEYTAGYRLKIIEMCKSVCERRITPDNYGDVCIQGDLYLRIVPGFHTEYKRIIKEPEIPLSMINV